MTIPELKAALEKSRDEMAKSYRQDTGTLFSETVYMRAQNDLIPTVLMLAEALSEIQVKCEVTGKAYPIARKALEQLYAMVGANEQA